MMHIRILVELDDETIAAIRRWNGATGKEQIARLLRGLLRADLEQIRSEHTPSEIATTK